MDGFDWLMTLIVLLFFVQVAICLILLFARSLIYTNPQANQVKNKSWQTMLKEAVAEQIAFQVDAEYIASAASEELHRKLPVLEELRDKYLTEKLSGKSERATTRYDQALTVLASLREAARHFLQAVADSDQNACLIDLRPCGRRIQDAFVSLEEGELSRAYLEAREASDLALLAQRFILRLKKFPQAVNLPPQAQPPEQL